MNGISVWTVAMIAPIEIANTPAKRAKERS